MRCSLVEEKTDEEAADQQMEGALQRPFHQTWVRGPDVAGIHFLASTLSKTHFCGHLAVNYVPSIAKRWLSAATHASTGALLCHSNLVLGNRRTIFIDYFAPFGTIANSGGIGAMFQIVPCGSGTVRPRFTEQRSRWTDTLPLLRYMHLEDRSILFCRFSTAIVILPTQNATASA